MVKSIKDSLVVWSGSWIFRLGLSLTISGVSIYLAARHVTWEEVWDSLSQADLLWTAAALLSVLGNNLAKIMRWRLLTTTAQKPAGWNRLIMAFLAGQTLNSIYPGRVGDLGRAYISGTQNSERAFMLGTIVLEKMLDVISYAILALLVVFWMPMPAWVRGSVAGVTVVGVSLALGLFAISHLRKHAVMIPDGLAGWLDQTRQKFASSRPGQKLFTWLQMGSESLKILDKPGQLLLVIVCTAVVWGTALLTNLLVLQAFELGLNFSPNGFLASLLVLVGLIAGISIPSVPGRIGIFEYICVLSLQLFSVPAAMGLSYGILLHAVVFIPQSVAGLISLLASGLPARAKSL